MSARRKLHRLWVWWGRRHDRCDHCGRRAHLNDAWHSYGNDDGKVWHSECMAYLHWRRVAEERLTVVDIATSIGELTTSDITTVARIRVASSESYRTAEEANAENLAWRVMYDLDKLRSDEATDG